MKEYLFYQNNKQELNPIKENCLKPTVGRKMLGKKTLTGALTSNYASFMTESTMLGSQKNGGSKMNVLSARESIDSFNTHKRSASHYSGKAFTPQVFGNSNKENMITGPNNPPQVKGKKNEN